ncbi:hypothetical protein IFM89_028966 [Coptis chinensis]|uniref:MPN domain-containing protein n=1 Tax=Coptis chinensis TaxID=261450 RepID=A0A835IC41_9MAGN|nr:hypothetical protein IFM89_028966 [Coptis chinensis]
MEKLLSSLAQKTWELENNITETPSSFSDEIYSYDESSQAKIQRDKPWTKDPHYFKRVKISALALLKMVVHSRSGGTIEVMGLMQGKTEGDTIIVMDAFALPVEGTETRVNAQADAYEYMVEYSQINKQAGRLENVVGWYHSHPGYGCWLSGIDCSTQMLNQQFQEPFLAVVVDPTRTVSAGKVEIGAFRTYPEGYKPAYDTVSEYQTIPLNKIEDFGVHCKQVTLFLSFFEFAAILETEKLEQAENYIHNQCGSFLQPNTKKEPWSPHLLLSSLNLEQVFLELFSRENLAQVPDLFPFPLMQEDNQLAKITRDSSKITVEQVHGLMSQVIKDILFNSVRHSNGTPTTLEKQSGPKPLVET